MSGNKRKHDSSSESARGRRHAGSGAPGRQGATVERSPVRRHDRVATGTASTERNHGRATVASKNRENREGTG